MGKTPRHHRTGHTARGMIALTIVLALLVAPLVVLLTHGPATQAAAASMTAEMADDVGGHDHNHGHTHGDGEHDRPGGPVGGHNAADHDHPLHALTCQPTNAPAPRADKGPGAFGDIFRHLTFKGPMRPPRSV